MALRTQKKDPLWKEARIMAVRKKCLINKSAYNRALPRARPERRMLSYTLT
jgi:hypothetical protein